MTAAEMLKREIADLRLQLASREKALRLLSQFPAPNSSETDRFMGSRPLYAIRKVLKENGGPMKVEELMNVLLRNGISNGKKRGHHNVRISIELNEKLGNLIVRNGMVSLPAADAAGPSRAS